MERFQSGHAKSGNRGARHTVTARMQVWCRLSSRVAVACLLVLVTGNAMASKQPLPIEFTLTDQNGQRRVVQYPREKISVFVVADQKGSGDIAGWIAPLYARYQEQVEISGIAALPGIPPMFHALFRREFKKRLTYPVMLDWDGAVARSFGYENERAELFVIGRDGRVALRRSGPANERALAQVIAEIDRLRGRR